MRPTTISGTVLAESARGFVALPWGRGAVGRLSVNKKKKGMRSKNVKMGHLALQQSGLASKQQCKQQIKERQKRKRIRECTMTTCS